jgi:hypothetical protein
MLAKQGRRLLTNPKSLCARVMKEKYYPNTPVLQTEACSGVTYAWRSVLKGIDLWSKVSLREWGMGLQSTSGRTPAPSAMV